MSKKLILGVGTNSKGRYEAKVNGTTTLAYKTWHSMIARCYCPKRLARWPTYIGCSVDKRWLDYQEFAEWFYNNPYKDKGYHLDKDLLVVNNKLYSPETCCFVPQELNKLLTSSASARGALPQGVNWYKRSGRYQARVMVDGKNRSLGYFDTETEAYKAYKVAKEAHVKRMANHWRDRIAPNVFNALMNWQLNA